jgi:hypothetical protein
MMQTVQVALATVHLTLLVQNLQQRFGPAQTDTKASPTLQQINCVLDQLNWKLKTDQLIRNLPFSVQIASLMVLVV